MKFLRSSLIAIAGLAVLVYLPVHAQDGDALPQSEDATETTQSAPTDTIDLDNPDAANRLTVPSDNAEKPQTLTTPSSKPGPTAPGQASASASAAKEANNRQTQAIRARKAISDANVLRSSGQLEAASERLEFALNNLYSTGASAADFQRASYGLAAVRAEQAALEYKQENWNEAVSLYEKSVALDPANPGYRQGLASARERQAEAIAAGKRVDESSSNNPAITPEFVERVKIVRRLFYEYERFVDTGQYDKAGDRLKRVLALDPYNRTARQLQRELEKKKYRAATEFRDMTRERAMLDVTETWYEPVPPTYGLQEDEQERKDADISRLAQMENKLRQITVPSIQFESLDIEQVVQFLEQKAFELDETGIEPRGVNFVLNLNTGGGVDENGEPIEAPNITRRVSLSLTDVPLSEVLRFVSTITNLQVKVDEYAVVLAPTGSREFLDTRTFSAPPGFIPADVAATGTDEAGFQNVEGVTVDVKEVLTSKGVSFDAPGSTAIFLGNVNRLIVKNTPAELDIIDALIRSGAATEQPQVEIETKFAEFTDDSLKALYFEYYYSATQSISATVPALAPYNFFPGNLPLNAGTLKSAGQTALRTAETQGSNSSAFAGITPNGVDQLLLQNSPVSAFGPNNFLTGQTLGINDFNTVAVGMTIDDRGFAAVAQLIDNLQGVDLLASPKVTTKNRTPATIEVVRELRYPTEFERPEINPEVFVINQDFDDPAGIFLGESVFVVLPATPREFEIRNIGVTLNVTPTTYPDQRIDLELEPEVVDFEGFIDYGGDITQIQFTQQVGIAPDVIGAQVIADGVVNQPVFSVRSIKTKMQVLDGQTIVMGGLIREDRQEINDKVPFMGDLPLVGRLFTSKVEKSVKRNLMMFVTARLIKSDGTPLYSNELPEEQIDKLEISPDLSPMIAPPPPPRYIRVRRDPKQMYDGKMLVESKAMYEEEVGTKSMGGSVKTIEFEEDETNLYETIP